MRDNGTLTMPAGATLIDNVAWFDGNNTQDLAYGSGCCRWKGAATAATRIPNDYDQSISAWYYGNLNATSNSSITYNPGDIGPLPAWSSKLAERPPCSRRVLRISRIPTSTRRWLI